MLCQGLTPATATSTSTSTTYGGLFSKGGVFTRQRRRHCLPGGATAVGRTPRTSTAVSAIRRSLILSCRSPWALVLHTPQ
jgi:hypothetical protein